LQASELNARLPTFDNNISRVFEVAAPHKPLGAAAQPRAARSATGRAPLDWSNPATLCAMPDAAPS
jgi:hypothetical protein